VRELEHAVGEVNPDHPLDVGSDVEHKSTRSAGDVENAITGPGPKLVEGISLERGKKSRAPVSTRPTVEMGLGRPRRGGRRLSPAPPAH
jgi:hypothetical protein